MFLFAAHAHFQGERRGLAIASRLAAAGPRHHPARRTRTCTATCSRSTRPCSSSPRSRPAWSSAACARPSRPRACAPATSRAARCRPRARCVAGSRRRSTTGPVQELIGLDMMLGAARQAAAKGDQARALAADRRGAGADRAQRARAARRDRRARPLRVRGARLRDRDRELHPGLAQPLRLRGAGHDPGARAARRRSPATCSGSPRRPSSTPAATRRPRRSRSRCARWTTRSSCA